MDETDDTTEWDPIIRVEVDPRDALPDGRRDVMVRVSRIPPDAWAELFLDDDAPWVEGETRRLRMDEDVIRIAPPEDRIDAFLAAVDERIEDTNRRYEDAGLPGL